MDFGTNRGEKNGKPLRTWIENFVENKALYLNRHLIPENEELWDAENFADFLTERCSLIINKINQYEKG